MTTTELYTKGACVWVPDPEAVWVSAQLLQDHHPGDQHITIQLSDGTVLEFPVKSSGLPPLGNPEILEGENDLTALTFLHEAAVLHNLRVRFLDYNSIYTYCGIVLVALNPYEPLPIYGEEVIDAYSGQDTDEMEPHIFSVAEEAYRTMIREEKNQSIIISGESGSGKTVSAKFTMRYFAVVGGASQQTTVEEKVLASNPIMEAIGNAKTTRNDNSSRFGKYIQIEFGCRGDIVGANMRTYLLEKSRVVSQPAHERNYHIFYQLCSSKNLPELRILKLESAEDFHYTNQGQEEVQIPGVNDAAELERTRQAFTTLGVQPDQQMEIFRVLAAILHLGNIKVKASGRDGDHSYIDVKDRSLVVFAKLLGVEGAQMAQWLCHKRLSVGAEVLVKPMTGQQAKEARDALAKHMYEQLFTWMVLRLNLSLRAHREKPKSYIGVLDIYGFEMFEKNSFEQFCINYANEKLQQQFNRHVFQLEQEEYLREEIPWNRIEFSDNQPCIDLIEGQLGMLDLLDEECRMPKGSDENWAQKLYDQHMNHSSHFRKPRLSNSSFIILHFADTVQYECVGFLDKNRDTVFEEPVNILRASQSELVAELFQKDLVEGSPPNSSLSNKGSRSGKRSHRDHKLTVGFQFRQSLNLLMDTLNNTTPHYVRCIKSNDLKQPFLFDPKRAVQQLRACGVLETIRISAAGFPSRWTYAEFFSRYRVLLRGGFSLDDVRWFCQRALPDLIPDAEQYCFGKTKVFFRAGQVALLEKLRGDRLYAAGIKIQSCVRGWLQRRRYQSLCKAALILQRYIRGTLARRLAWTIRYTRAALIIQKTYRMVSVRQLYLTIRNATIKIQSFLRGFQARQIHRRMLVDQAVVSLQAWVRGWLTRRRFTRIRAAVVVLQSCVRRRAARKELLRLRTEARSMERYRELNKGMEVKLMQLQLRADQQTRECGSLKETLQAEREAHNSELELLRSNLHKLQSQMKANANTAPSLNEKNEEQRRKAEEKVAEELLHLKQEIQVLLVEKESLETERNDLVIRLQAQQEAQEESRQQSANLVDESVRADLEEERSRYQSLLREFTRLEQRYDNLRDMSIFTTDEHPRGHRRTDSIVSLEPPSPITTSYPGSPIFSSSDSERRISVTSPEMARRISVTSPEMVRRISVTSPEGFRRFSVTSLMDRRAFSLEEPLDLLMEELGIAKNKTEKLNFEDLNHAYDAVRVANKFLETQLLSQKEQWEEEVSALRMKLQQAQDSSGDPEMMDLNTFHERECSRLRQEVKELKHTVTLRRILSYAGFGVASQEPASPSSRNQFSTGLLECRKKDESKLIKSLITDVKAEGIISLVPGLAARVLFLCVRQMDCCEDRTRVKMFCGAVVSAIKTALKKHVSDSDATAAWLKNSYLLKDLLNQHSPPQDMGCEDLVPIGTDVQECVRALGDVCIQAYQQLLSISESRLQPIIVPAMLESETIPGLSVSTLKLGSGRKRSGSDPRPPVSTEGATMSAVLRELTALHTALSRQDLPAALLERAFHQLIYLLATTTLNSLLLRKDMCCWNRGLQIRYNVSVLEEWLRSRSLQTGGAVAALEPLIQAAQLLQMSKKTEADGEALVQTCNALSSQQIVKILSLYTPQSDLEERVTLNFIRAVQVLLKGRSEGQPPQLLMDVRRVFPVTFPYLPPAHVSAAQLEIPESLKISFLRRV